MADITKATSGETVTIACKIPAGLVLRTFHAVKKSVPQANGSMRDVDVYVDDPDQVVVNGFSHPQDKAPGHPIIGGFGLTYGVPKDFWAKWLAQNKDSDVVRNGMIFAHEKPNFAEGSANERAALKSGLERLDPEKPPVNIIPGSKAAA